MTSFNALPNELKTRIFEFLQLGRHNPSSSPWYKHHVYECRDALVALSLVSRDVYSLATPLLSASVYRTKPSGAAEYYLTNADLQSFTAPFKHTRSVAIEAMGMGNIADTLWIAGFRTKLRKLVIVRSPWTLEEIVCQLSIAFKDLSRLEVLDNRAVVGERNPTLVKDRVRLPLANLEALAASNTELAHLYHTYQVHASLLAIHYDSASPGELVWGEEGGPSEFCAKEDMHIKSLCIPAWWTPSFAVLPAALQVLCLMEHPLTKALYETVKALPNLKILEISSQDDLFYLRQLPEGLSHFYYHAYQLDEVEKALREIPISKDWHGRTELHIEIVLDFDAFDKMSPARCRASNASIQQAVAHIQNFNGKINIDVSEILQHLALCEKQWPYHFGIFDHTGRRLLFPGSPQEVQYAVDRLCLFARAHGGLLPYIQFSYSYNTRLGERLAEDLADEERVGDHLVRVLAAWGYIMRTDEGWLPGALKDGNTAWQQYVVRNMQERRTLANDTLQNKLGSDT